MREPAGIARRPPERSVRGVFADGAADLPEHRHPFAFRLQRLAAAPDDRLAPPEMLEDMAFVRFGERRQCEALPGFLRQHVAGEVVPRVTPEGRLSCSRCMIRTIAPVFLSLRRL